MSTFHTRNETETFALGRRLAASLKGGEVLLLEGELGSGKTVFVKGLAAGLGLTKVVTSPTFVIMNLYHIVRGRGRIRSLAHVDTYRLSSVEELVDIGLRDYIGQSESIVAIEWPEKVVELLPDGKIIHVAFSHGDTIAEREVTISR